MIGIVVLLTLTVLLDVVGQVCFKLGVGHDDGSASSRAGRRPGVSGFLHSLIGSHWIVAGVVIYIAEFIVWFAALTQAPLSLAYPFNALAYCGVVLASRYVLHEKVSLQRWFGTFAIAAGVALVLLP
jgi:multidrug transporter EmrE-like cation transporter